MLVLLAVQLDPFDVFLQVIAAVNLCYMPVFSCTATCIIPSFELATGLR
jgi:hypothetical protein